LFSRRALSVGGRAKDPPPHFGSLRHPGPTDKLLQLSAANRWIFQLYLDEFGKILQKENNKNRK
jgi:hypothetical protein